MTMILTSNNLITHMDTHNRLMAPLRGMQGDCIGYGDECVKIVRKKLNFLKYGNGI